MTAFFLAAYGAMAILTLYVALGVCCRSPFWSEVALGAIAVAKLLLAIAGAVLWPVALVAGAVIELREWRQRRDKSPASNRTP